MQVLSQVFRGERYIKKSSKKNSILVIDSGDIEHSFLEKNTAKTFFQDSYFEHDTLTTHEVFVKSLSDYDIIHFIAHGSANIDDPYQSTISLGGGTQLTVQELIESDVAPSDLYILSACETGFHGINDPDELISMPSVLLQTGVKGVISTRWKIDSFSAAIMMSVFYYFYKVQDYSAATALWYAQKWMRTTDNFEKADFIEENEEHFKDQTATLCDALTNSCTDYSHPYYWAGFMYSGR